MTGLQPARRRRGRRRRRPGPTVRAAQVVVATSAYSGWLRRLSPLFVPVYDYVLVSEPLTPDQRAAIGWAGRAGPVGREQPVPLLPADGRRPDPVGRLRRDPLPGQPGRARARSAAGDVRQARRRSSSGRSRSSTGWPSRTAGAAPSTRPRGSRSRSARRWAAGSRTPSATPAWASGRRRWAAGVVRDFILRPDEDRLRLRLVDSPPVPFPPEPLRSSTVDIVRHELDRADRNEGRRGVILQTLDALGIGFDS